MTAKYRVVKWTLDIIKKEYSQKKLILPSYQRSLKWDEERRKKLIDTMRQGNPIGTFLLFQDPDSKKYQIVDGLQRISTIIGYFSNTKKYIDKDILDFELIENIVKTSCEGSAIQYIPEKFESIILHKKEAVIQKYRELGEDQSGFNIEILKIMDIDIASYNLYKNAINDVIRQINERVSLENIEIPVIIYSANKRDLPKIFTDINQNSLVLTEYEIFAAQWSDINVGEVSSELLNKLKNKYEKINNDPDSGF